MSLIFFSFLLVVYTSVGHGIKKKIIISETVIEIRFVPFSNRAASLLQELLGDRVAIEVLSLAIIFLGLPLFLLSLNVPDYFHNSFVTTCLTLISRTE